MFKRLPVPSGTVVTLIITFSVFLATPIGAAVVGGASVTSPEKTGSEADQVTIPTQSISPNPESQFTNNDDPILYFNMTLGRDLQNNTLLVNMSVSIPSTVHRLNLYLPNESNIKSLNDFKETDNNRYTTTSSNGWILYRVPFNYSSEFGLEAVNRDEWAFVGTSDYQFTGWRTIGRVAAVQEQTRIKKSGIGDDFAYFGNYSTIEIETNDTRIELVVPDSATPPTSAVSSSLAAADRALNVTATPDRIRAYVAPDPIREGGRAEWGDGELPEFWVGDGTGVNSSGNVWVHELVHTHQAYSTSAEMEWFTEASAEYYATYLTFQQERITFEDFRKGVHAYTDRSAVLSKPEEWPSTSTPYEKGSHVLAALDAKIRAESNGTGTLKQVFRQMNKANGTVDLPRFKSLVASVAGSSLDGWIDRYVTTSAIPSIPNNPSAFGDTQRTLAEYAGDDSVIDTDELMQIISDWASGKISTEFLDQAIRAWASEQPVD